MLAMAVVRRRAERARGESPACSALSISVPRAPGAVVDRGASFLSSAPMA
jgi:hypothetical protein